VYRELARLHADGGVTVKVVAQDGKPDKKIYAITRPGLEELRRWILAPTEAPRPQYDLLVKLLGAHVVERPAFRKELQQVHTQAQEWVNTLKVMRRECIRSRAKGWSEHEQILYLTLRRGLLLGQAQLRWLGEVSEFFASGKLAD
jgi:DNA-binding PadR family transcriptional regulator